jgi:hypothetical protein
MGLKEKIKSELDGIVAASPIGAVNAYAESETVKFDKWLRQNDPKLAEKIDEANRQGKMPRLLVAEVSGRYIKWKKNGEK